MKSKAEFKVLTVTEGIVELPQWRVVYVLMDGNQMPIKNGTHAALGENMA
jgi:hypothetical protein